VLIKQLGVSLNLAIYERYRPLADSSRAASSSKLKSSSPSVAPITIYRAVTALDMTRTPDAGRSIHQLGRLYNAAHADDTSLGYAELYAMQKVFENWNFQPTAASLQKKIDKS